MTLDIRWSTDLVTFFAPQGWGLPADLPYDAWERAVALDPQSYFDRMLDEAAEIGLEGIELAPAPGGWVSALRAYGSAARFKSELDDRGLVLSGSYVLPVGLSAVLAATDIDVRRAAERAADEDLTQHVAFLREVGCDTLITSTVPRAPFSDVPGVDADADAFDQPADRHLIEKVAEQLNRAGSIAAREGVVVGIHTDAYSVASRVDDVDELMRRTDSENVKLVIDAGHISLDDGDPLEVLRRNADRAPILHWKDCAAHLPPHRLSGPPMVRHDEMIKNFRVMGDGGRVDWRAWIEILRRASWRGWGVAEIDMSPAPKSEIRAGLDYFIDVLDR